MENVAESGTRKVLRTFVLALFALCALALCALVLAQWNVRSAMFGWNLAPNGTRIIYVTPDYPAYRAGIRAGNIIDWTTLPTVGRANLRLVQTVPADTRLRVNVIERHASRSLTLVPVALPELAQRSERIVVLADLLLIFVGVVLVYMRPTRMTWGFLLSFLAAACTPLQMWGQAGPQQLLLVNGMIALLTGVSATGILMFMSRFPSDRPLPALRFVDRCAIPLGIVAGGVRLVVVTAVVFASAPPPRWAVFVSQYVIELVLIVLALAALSTSLMLTRGSDRQRIIPVLCSFAFFVAVQMTIYIYSALYTDPRATGVLNVLAAAAMVALAISVAHGVLRHRVLDVSFVISRTLVYTVLTSIIVGGFALIDFISSKMLEHLQVAAVFEAVAALALGVWLNVLHSRIDHFVDRIFFRRRHLAEARLERTARTLAHAEDAGFIDEALVVEACEALGLSSAAVFRRDETGDYVRVCARGWDASQAARLPPQDYLIVNLKAQLERIDLADVRWPRTDVPTGTMFPLMAIPLVVRHEMLGCVLYGGHIGGEGIDPDERESLVRLASAAASAYEHVEMKSLVTQSQELRVENDMLVREQHLLREMVDTLRRIARPVQS